MKTKNNHDRGIGAHYGYSSPQKYQVRLDTIIEPYLRYSGLTCIPNDRQYWALASYDRCTAKNAELEQLLEHKLIQPHQFYGISAERSVIEGNAKTYPDCQWRLKHWYDAIQQEPFLPAIVYYDTINVLDNNRILEFANTVRAAPTQCLIVANWQMFNPYSGRKIDLQAFYNALPDWAYPIEIKTYLSNEGKRQGQMVSFITWKP